MSDLISRQWLMECVNEGWIKFDTEKDENRFIHLVRDVAPSAQPERLTDDDFETIRIHLNAYKEKLCNQQRWKEADEYQRIIDRFMAFASAQPERKKGRWTKAYDGNDGHVKCTGCFKTYDWISQAQYYNYCPNCGADMRKEEMSE